MRPVTDKNKISRAKLSYIIDSTAAPVCIIAPISSWAAVAGFVKSAWIALPIALMLMIGTLFIMKVISDKKAN